MMKAYRYMKGVMMALTILLVSACTNNDSIFPEEESNVQVTFRPTLRNQLDSRSIGDAQSIEQVLVVVYDEDNELINKFTQDWTSVDRHGVTLPLISGLSYKILFWAENEDNDAYTLYDDEIHIDYSSYENGGFAKMEKLDAFYGICALTVDAQDNRAKTVELSRPLAQLNIVDNTTIPQQGKHHAKVIFHRIPVSFNPFTGEVTMTETQGIAFSFTDFPTETLEVDGVDCHYLASNYLFAPAQSASAISATIVLSRTDGSYTKTIEFKGSKTIPIERNKKTNVVGSLLSGM